MGLKGLQGIKGGYMGLQAVKGSYRGLQRNTKNDRGLQPVKRERKRSKWLNKKKNKIIKQSLLSI